MCQHNFTLGKNCILRSRCFLSLLGASKRAALDPWVRLLPPRFVSTPRAHGGHIFFLPVSLVFFSLSIYIYLYLSFPFSLIPSAKLREHSRAHGGHIFFLPVSRIFFPFSISLFLHLATLHSLSLSLSVTPSTARP